MEMQVALLGAALTLLYLLPMIIAYCKHKRNADAICVLNVFLGWMVIGWIGALVWAMTHDA